MADQKLIGIEIIRAQVDALAESDIGLTEVTPEAEIKAVLSERLGE